MPYSRVLEITKDIGIKTLKKYEINDCFVPDIIKNGIFTVVAMDTIDLNARCTIVKSHFHGISMSILQFPSYFNPGQSQEYNTGYQNVVVHTGDTDVLVLLISFRPMAKMYSNVYAYFMKAGTLRIYDVNALCFSIGIPFCGALSFFYTFTGCDTVSSFFNVGKCIFYDTLFTFTKVDLLTEVFKVLGQETRSICEYQIDIIEKNIIHVYYPKANYSQSLDVIRLLEFEGKPHDNLRQLPPSKGGLVEHIKRSCYQAGWICTLCYKEVQLPDPTSWGWKQTCGGM